MTTEILIEKVREEIGSLSTESEQAVATALKILQRDGTKSSAQPSEENFVSHNITLEEYTVLPSAEKRRYLDEAENLNQRWVTNQLRKHNATWIMVVDGQVVLAGARLKDYPEHEDFLALCKRTGKYPFVFFNPRVFAIEEHSTAWHSTYEPDHLYPALSLALPSKSQSFDTEADLDTGAVHCYCALELLTVNGIVEIKPDEVERTSQHLGRPFTYFTKHLWLELVDEKGTRSPCRAPVFCVKNWHNSPFTTINPTRTFLLGRSVLFELKPRLTLDFAACRTEVQFPEATS
jgi:hypothetical protein